MLVLINLYITLSDPHQTSSRDAAFASALFRRGTTAVNKHARSPAKFHPRRLHLIVEKPARIRPDPRHADAPIATPGCGTVTRLPRGWKAFKAEAPRVRTKAHTLPTIEGIAIGRTRDRSKTCHSQVRRQRAGPAKRASRWHDAVVRQWQHPCRQTPSCMIRRVCMRSIRRHMH